jgi:hypothetical protein
MLFSAAEVTSAPKWAERAGAAKAKRPSKRRFLVATVDGADRRFT